MSEKPSENRDKLEQLIPQIRGGSPEAWETLLNWFRPILLRRAQRILDDRLRGMFSPQDLVQATLLRAFRKKEKFRGQTLNQWCAWMLQTMVNFHRNLLRQYCYTAKRGEGRTVSLSENPSLAGGLVAKKEKDKELLARVRQVLDQLPEKDREILSLKTFENLSFPEIATMLHCSEDAARSRFRRAVTELSALLYPKGPE